MARVHITPVKGNEYIQFIIPSKGQFFSEPYVSGCNLNCHTPKPVPPLCPETTFFTLKGTPKNFSEPYVFGGKPTKTPPLSPELVFFMSKGYPHSEPYVFGGKPTKIPTPLSPESVFFTLKGYAQSEPYVFGGKPKPTPPLSPEAVFYTLDVTPGNYSTLYIPPNYPTKIPTPLSPETVFYSPIQLFSEPYTFPSKPTQIPTPHSPEITFFTVSDSPQLFSEPFELLPRLSKIPNPWIDNFYPIPAVTSVSSTWDYTILPPKFNQNPISPVDTFVPPPFFNLSIFTWESQAKPTKPNLNIVPSVDNFIPFNVLWDYYISLFVAQKKVPFTPQLRDEFISLFSSFFDTQLVLPKSTFGKLIPTTYETPYIAPIVALTVQPDLALRPLPPSQWRQAIAYSDQPNFVSNVPSTTKLRLLPITGVGR